MAAQGFDCGGSSDAGVSVGVGDGVVVGVGAGVDVPIGDGACVGVGDSVGAVNIGTGKSSWCWGCSCWIICWS